MDNTRDLSLPFVRVVSGLDETCAFEHSMVDVRFGDPDDPPLAKSTIIPATSISFCSTPANQVVDFHAAAGSQLIIILAGELRVATPADRDRTFGLGDFLELSDATGNGHLGRMHSKAPTTFALFELGQSPTIARALPRQDQVNAEGAKYVRTTDGPDGLSRTSVGTLPYLQNMPYGQSTEKFSITGIQFVFAPGDLDYTWHRAPQRQFVLPMTGGMEVENGLGHRHAIRPGEIYIGEDVSGNGHITRAIEAQRRLSIFAHLADEASN